ncbi:MAG: DUF166 family protein [Methanosarcinales archaeon Met12]|nr:MAG: DUF166 family protein [Methanosarcinales archaeon Met12]
MVKAKDDATMLIGVITRGEHGLDMVETIESKTDMSVISTTLPSDMPEFIEDATHFLKGIDEAVFNVDMLITYSLHPDLTPEVIKLAGKYGTRAVIVPGGYARAGTKKRLDELSQRYKIHILVDEICCTLETCENDIINEFTSKLGRPKYKVTTSNGIITKVDVITGTPCGGSWFVAENLVGTSSSEAPIRASLLIQYYPCRNENIHKAAEIQKEAIIEALGTSTS